MSTKIDFRKVLKKKEKKDKEQEKIKETIKKNEKVKEKKPRKRRRFRFFYWLLVLIVFFCLCTFVAGVGFCYYIVTSAPEFDTESIPAITHVINRIPIIKSLTGVSLIIVGTFLVIIFL